MVLRSVSCQQDNQLIWQIFLRTVDFYRIDAWKSILQGKNENILEVYSISLWICLPWDFCASSWDRTILLSSKPWDLRGLLHCINRFSLLSQQMKSCGVTIHMKLLVLTRSTFCFPLFYLKSILHVLLYNTYTHHSSASCFWPDQEAAQTQLHPC